MILIFLCIEVESLPFFKKLQSQIPVNQTRVRTAANAVSMLTADSLALAQRDSKAESAREKQVILDELFVNPTANKDNRSQFFVIILLQARYKV